MYPKSPFTYAELSDDAAKRREQLISLFGHYVFDSRVKSLDLIERLLESEETREKDGKINAESFEVLSQKLAPNDITQVKGVASRAIELFSKFLFSFFGSIGNSYALDQRHSVRLRVEMEIVDNQTGEVVCSENINTHGEKAMPSYWGSWMLASRSAEKK